jgi:serine/threonine protein kinase
MVGTTISHYRIVRQLGSGGMGVVYAAEDDRLGRAVALKFVPDDLARDAQTLKRLRAEARTASALSHPNICTIYDIDEFEGRPFIVMELLKGQTLRERLDARPLKIQEVVDIGIQIADALDCAHAQGIIHRDIKPANLFLMDRGQVKIVDFGIAKLFSRYRDTGTTSGTSGSTAAGLTPGTAGYMSPEQVSGEELDGRTDIFSFGIVLYECVTGRQPFEGRTSGTVFSAILNKAPIAPRVFNAELPSRLEDVITNCLEKDRELRYQNAGDLRADLKRIKRDLESTHPPGTTLPIPTADSRPDSPARASDTHVIEEGRTSKRRTAIAAAIGAMAIVGVVALYVIPGPRTQPATPSAKADTAAPNTPAPAPAPAPSPAPPAAPAPAGFDRAVAEATRALGAGDLDTATKAIERARAIDPASPVVTSLSIRLVNEFRVRAEAARRTPQVPQPSTTLPTPRPQAAGEVARGQQPAPPVTVEPPPPAVPPPTPAPAPPASSAREDANAPPREPTVSPATPPAREGAAPAPPAIEDDDTAIRRVVATYGRAIERKDLALFRSIKPNMSAQEQRRLEEGFRAVTSQRVAITILGIDRRGQEASVRLRRTDTIEAGGRQQTTETQQTMTLVRAGGAWVIGELTR